MCENAIELCILLGNISFWLAKFYSVWKATTTTTANIIYFLFAENKSQNHTVAAFSGRRVFAFHILMLFRYIDIVVSFPSKRTLNRRFLLCFPTILIITRKKQWKNWCDEFMTFRAKCRTCLLVWSIFASLYWISPKTEFNKK